MNILNLNKLYALLLIAALASIANVINAAEQDSILDDAIRQQIFVELKSNVEYLYRSSRYELEQAAAIPESERIAASDNNRIRAVQVNRSTAKGAADW